MKLSRRGFVAAAGAGIGTAGAMGRVPAQAGPLHVGNPRVQCLEHPLGVEDAHPRFSWRLAAEGRGVRQHSYRIRVAASAARLREGGADLWDSGVVVSRRSFDVAYRGMPLASRQRCFWSVEVTDNRGRKSASDPAWWEMGLLAARDWNASWLVVEDAAGKTFRSAHAGGAKGYPAQPAMLMRRKFSLDRAIVSARLYATALGAYEARLNGRRIGDRKIAPEITDFRKHVLYQVYDVTDLVTVGDNLLGATVGEGWYGSPYTWAAVPYMFGPPPCRFMAQLEMRYADGSSRTICTDSQWRTAPSAILFSQIYDGETYDARKEQKGWDAAGFDDSNWAPVEIADAPSAALAAQISPPIREIMTLTPVSVSTTGPGVQVFDFGQNFAGWARLKVKGPAGTKVTLRFAEILKPNGEVDQSNLRSAKATDTYILRGDPEGEVFEPHFTYHGFRYVELSGFPGTAAAGALTGIVVHSDLPVTGRFLVGNPVIQKFWENAMWSERSNFVAIPTDCPQRDERMGWLGDAQVFWDAASFNMDTDAFTNRFMREVRDGQTGEGAFPEVTPQYAPGRSLFGAPGWADAGIILPWTVFRHYGDTAIIDGNWDAMGRWIAFLLKANPDLIWRHKRGTDYGDWLAVDAKEPNDETTPKALIGTAFWAHTTDLMARMALATERTKEHAYYADLSTRIRAAFRKEFVKPDGQIGNGSQTSFVLPLAFGLLPEDRRTVAAMHLAASIRSRGTKLSTGFLGTPYILDALASSGLEELAVELLLQTGYPSWGYMVMKGATTMWEHWNSDVDKTSMNSYNHYAFGAVVAFMYRRLAGIDMGAPGVEDISIRPICDPRLKFASGDYDSIYGRISTEWRRDGEALELTVTIPANADATIRIPAGRHQAVRESGRILANRDGMRAGPRAADHMVVFAGSGTYRFTVD